MGLLRRLLMALKGGSRDEERPAPPRAALGRKGENAAARFLEGKGYRILERNFRTLRGEIDLIAFRDGTLAFVEVRSQTQPSELDPLCTVTPRKQARVVRAAHAYCAGRRPLPPETMLRFDVVAVRFTADGSQQDIRHIEGAFEASPRGFS
jgi:putative endonuclease